MKMLGKGQIVTIKKEKTHPEWIKSLYGKYFAITSYKRCPCYDRRKKRAVIETFYVLDGIAEGVNWSSKELEQKTEYDIYGRIVWMGN